MKPPLPFDVDTFLARLDAMDAALVAADFHPMSPWWRAQIERFLRARGSSAVSRWIIRAGRRAGKSSTLCRLAVAWALWGPWSIPLGDSAIVAFISVDRREAGGRVRTLAAILRVVGVAFDQRDGEIEIEIRSRPVLFRVATCTTSGVVGFTSIAIFGDEVALWRNTDSSANPAADVFSQATPTLATQPFGFSVLSSSVLSTMDYHFELFARGDTEHQLTSEAVSWVANPSITKEQTQALEPDPTLWGASYANIPRAQGSSAFDHDLVCASFRGTPEGRVLRPLGLIDASSGGGDAFAFGVAGYVQAPFQEPVLKFHAVD